MKRFSQFVYAVGAYKVGSEMYVAGRAYWNDAYEQVSLKDRLAIYRDSDGKDGDNWAIDNKETLSAFRRLKEINQVMCYTEIGALSKYEYALFGNSSGEKKLWDWTKLIEDKNFKRIRLSENKDIWPAFKKLFGGRQDG